MKLYAINECNNENSKAYNFIELIILSVLVEVIISV